MEPFEKEKGDAGGISRRRSMNPFSSRASLKNLGQINTNLGPNNNEEHRKDGNKLVKRGSALFGLGHSAGSAPSSAGALSPTDRESGNSPKLRPRTLQKQKTRPSSIFGSLGKKPLYIFEAGDDESDLTTTKIPYADEITPITPRKFVLHHGEVQTTSGLFRKKKEYLVLTDSHLIRFKSHSRASEVYPSIITGRARRHPSTASIGSLQETQSNHSHASGDTENRIPLEQIVAAYKVEDGRPYFTIEAVWLEEDDTNVVAGSIQLLLRAPDEADLWISSILGAAQKAKLLMKEPFPQKIVQYLADVVQLSDDYDPSCCKLLRVVRRAPISKHGKGSPDDLSKSGPCVLYLVVGIHHVHFIQLPDFTNSGRATVAKSKDKLHGIVTLVAIDMTESDNRFSLEFRLPLERPSKVLLASSATSDIAFHLFQAHQYLKPNWARYSFSWDGPKRFKELAEDPMDRPKEDDGGFNTTLNAYCHGYSCDPLNIQYCCNWDGDDTPEFKLLQPLRTTKYSIKELLSIMRALRYNEFFRSISFQDVDLHSLHGTMDSFGKEHVAMSTYDEVPLIDIIDVKPWDRSLLYQEIQGIALKSRYLTKMNFANTLPRRRVRDTSAWGGAPNDKDPGCEIIAAILPLTWKAITAVSWIILNGIELGDTDFEDLKPALTTKRSRIRAIECSNCGLNDDRMEELMAILEHQSTNTVALNIADNPGRIRLERLQLSIRRFSNIRILNLSKITRTPTHAAVFPPKLIVSWRLEELYLNGVPLNDATLESLSEYLMHDMSKNLRILELERTNLNGFQVGYLMRSMSRVPGKARELYLNVSNNMLEEGIEKIVQAIRDNQTPTQMLLRMLEFEEESHFRHILEALQTNTTIRFLDMSKVSLKYDASPETCDALKSLFIKNSTLEELDISGELTHLEVTRLGPGLNQALTGLIHNKGLKVLRIEYQHLGFEGSNALASVLESNRCLTHIYCAYNDIGMQAFTTLVQAMAKNYTVIDFPPMIKDREDSIKRMKSSLSELRKIEAPPPSKRFSTALGVGKLGVNQEMTPQDITSAVNIFSEQWNTLGKRLEDYLYRNRNLAVGMDEDMSDDGAKTSLLLTESAILHQVLQHTTPKIEAEDPVDGIIHRGKVLSMVDGNTKTTHTQDLTWVEPSSHQVGTSPLGVRNKTVFDLHEDSPDNDI